MYRGSPAWCVAGLLALHAPPALAQDDAVDEIPVRLTSQQMLLANAEALARGDPKAAATLLHALLHDPVTQVRNEARFRLARMAAAGKDYKQAAMWLRAILDEEPGAQRVRLELARLLGEMGDLAGARRELRQAQAGPLPPEVARVVDRFSAALRERKRLGGDIEVAIAPDTNINRATRSSTLSTIIGDFILADDAKAKSGVGLTLRGSSYARVPLSESVKLLGRASFEGNLYPASEFNDISLLSSIGPEIELRRLRIQAQAGFQRRWFGGRRYSDNESFELRAEHALDRTAQLSLSGSVGTMSVVPNPRQNATTIQFSASVEKALSPGAGVSLSVAGGRQVARDAGYSTWFGQLAAFGWHELGHTTILAGVTYAPLRSDERLSLYRSKRGDDLIRIVAAATLRQFTVHGFAPQLRLTWEHNASTIEIYRYARFRTELGIVRAF